MEAYNPDIVVIQLGIVDCAPRLLNDLERKLITKFPIVNSRDYIDLIKRIRKLNNTIVTDVKFRKNLEKYIKRATENNVKKLISIGISYPDKKMIEKNKDIIKNIDKYNSLLGSYSKNLKNINVIFPLDSRNYKEEIFEDGYHPNKKGHEVIANELKSLISNHNE